MGRMDKAFKLFALFRCGHRGFLLSQSEGESVRLLEMARENPCASCELLRVAKARK
jgi:hypothetical protein